MITRPRKRLDDDFSLRRGRMKTNKSSRTRGMVTTGLAVFLASGVVAPCSATELITAVGPSGLDRAACVEKATHVLESRGYTVRQVANTEDFSEQRTGSITIEGDKGEIAVSVFCGAVDSLGFVIAGAAPDRQPRNEVKAIWDAMFE